MSASTQQVRLRFRPYRRQFARPLRVAWGSWSMREGIVLRMEDMETGAVGFGEIAPLEMFGTESVEDGLRYLFSMPREVSLESLEARVADAPPATAFGLKSALLALGQMDQELAQTPVQSAALVSCSDLLDDLDVYRNADVYTFKIKIGTGDSIEEQEQLKGILSALSPDERIRLDPNQSWSLDQWESWQALLIPFSDQIDFIEEPFQPDTLSKEELVNLAINCPLQLALDESLSRDGLDPWIVAGWPGYWIIKPSLMGNPETWQTLLASTGKVILSSAFETGIGLSAIIQLAGGLPSNVHGLGTNAFFDDAIGIPGHELGFVSLNHEQKEYIWNHLPDD